MSKYPFPIDAGGMALDRYLTTLLSALVKKAGGKLQISVSDILKVEDSVLLRYPSNDLRTIVLQLAPRNTDMYITQEAPPWHATQPPARPMRQPQPESVQLDPAREPVTPSPRISNTLDNLSLFLKEQEREEKLRQMQQADEVEARHQAGLSTFRTIPGR